MKKEEFYSQVSPPPSVSGSVVQTSGAVREKLWDHLQELKSEAGEERLMRSLPSLPAPPSGPSYGGGGQLYPGPSHAYPQYQAYNNQYQYQSLPVLQLHHHTNWLDHWHHNHHQPVYVPPQEPRPAPPPPDYLPTHHPTGTLPCGLWRVYSAV